MKVASESAGTSSSLLPSPSSLLPSLLHVYWALHGIHLILGGITLCSWWKDQTPRLQLSSSTGALSTRLPATHYPLLSLLPSPFSLLQTAAPWILLGLLFWIPGIYLEWPSDPWEHLRRINEWHILDTVTAHTAWMKSSYFLPYSLTGHTSGLSQLNWLNYYYTGICLLLCWQYYRLARACGLGERASMVFVILQALLFGNNVFSFYRYYGISSSIYAQLGAVALTRLALEVAKHTQLSLRSFFSLTSTFAGRPATVIPSTGDSSPSTSPAVLTLDEPRHSHELVERATAGFLQPPPAVYWVLPAATALLLLTAFNHVQGLGIAGLGIGAVIVWKLIEWKRSMFFWLVAGAIVLSISTILWLPRLPLIDSVYRPAGWLNAWYGFTLFSWRSPTVDRAIQILGILGVVNFLAGILLLRRNHVIGWLTAAPLIALALPFVALPFANSLAAQSEGEIIVFHRMIFAIPSGLALTCCLKQMGTQLTVFSFGPFSRSQGFPAIAMIIAGLVSLAPDRPYYNRFWHFFSATPQDLQLRSILPAINSTTVRLRNVRRYRLVATDAMAFVFNTASPVQFSFRERPIGQPMAESINRTAADILSWKATTANVWPTLTRDPLAVDPSAWISVGGSAPEFIRGIADFHASSTALHNPPGRLSEVLTSDTIFLDPTKAFCVELSLKQSTRTRANAYPAIAWYDAEGRLLIANAPLPMGAGNPTGWANGTYSYFGLIAAVAPTTWTTYRASFGLHGVAAVPSNAKSFRVGALLNYNATPDAVIQITNIRVWEKADSETVADGTFPQDASYFIVVPTGRILSSPSSQAGQLSRHWPAQQVPSDLAGGIELMTDALLAGAVSVDPDNMLFELASSRDRQ